MGRAGARGPGGGGGRARARGQGTQEHACLYTQVNRSHDGARGGGGEKKLQNSNLVPATRTFLSAAENYCCETQKNPFCKKPRNVQTAFQHERRAHTADELAWEGRKDNIRSVLCLTATLLYEQSFRYHHIKTQEFMQIQTNRSRNYKA